MEEAIAKQFAKILTEVQVDQWGNTQLSPVTLALNKYVEDNKDKLFEKVIEKLTVEKIAEAMTNRLLEVAKGVYGSFYDREAITKQLKDKVAEHMAKQIAKDLKFFAPEELPLDSQQ